MRSDTPTHRLYGRLDAAAYLAVSPMTFDRLRVRFEIPFRRVPGAGETGRRIVANENGFVLVNVGRAGDGSDAIALAASKAVREFAALLDRHARATDPKGDGGSQCTRCEAADLERAGFSAAQAILELVVAANREAGREGNIPMIERRDAE